MIARARGPERRLYAALEYLEAGLPLTICKPGTKSPLGLGWNLHDNGHRWQFQRWTPEEIERVYETFGDLNCGCILGPDSGLIDLECDSPAAEVACAKLFADVDCPIAPTFLSARGKHRLFAVNPRLVQLERTGVHYEALEIRLGGHHKGVQSLLPPSQTDNVERTWLVSWDDCPVQPLPNDVVERILGTTRNGSKPIAEQAELAHRAHREPNIYPVCSVSSVCQVHHPPPSAPSAIEAIIQLTLPPAYGHRYWSLFRFARRLKALPEFREASAQELKPWVRAWHSAALPYIRTKPFEETWLDFVNGWRAMRFAAGEGPICELFLQAQAEAPPIEAMQYEQEPLRELVAFCRHLDRVSGLEPFFLAGRTAAMLLNVPHRVVARWLQLLVADDLLEEVSKGTLQRASEYRWLGS